MITPTTRRWCPRPVFFVADLPRALRFYLDALGFSKKWHEADGPGCVCELTPGNELCFPIEGE